MRQMTFSESGFEVHSKHTRRQHFLDEMNTIVPWQKLCRLIGPHYPKGERGRPRIGTERMSRIYFLQVWFNLSNPAAEDALYDSAAMRAFVGIDLGREPAPDETTICERHLRDVLRSNAHFHNEVRTHPSLGKDAPLIRVIPTAGRIQPIPLIGGLYQHYVRI